MTLCAKCKQAEGVFPIGYDFYKQKRPYLCEKYRKKWVKLWDSIPNRNRDYIHIWKQLFEEWLGYEWGKPEWCMS